VEPCRTEVGLAEKGGADILSPGDKLSRGALVTVLTSSATGSIAYGWDLERYSHLSKEEDASSWVAIKENVGTSGKSINGNLSEITRGEISAGGFS